MSKVLRKYIEQIVAADIGGFESLAKGKKNIERTVYPEQSDLYNQKNIAIDFDGTIHKYSKGWDDGTPYDDPIDGAKEALDSLKEKGYNIIIHTSRLSSEADDVDNQMVMLKEWLDKNDIPYDRITADKVPCDHYVDDRSVRFENNWSDTIDKIKELDSKKEQK